jgi:hypothetical protein
LVVSGGVLGGASLWLLARARREVAGVAQGMTPATKTTVGLAGLILGYHLVAYGMPPGSMPLRVPPDRLWIGGLLAALAVGVSVLIDRLERRGDAGGNGPAAERE